jgi:NAD(P)H dehydrogenase (quinone)
MEKTLVIYTHPNKKGFCGKILDHVERELKKKNASYELIDLYAINYDPVLKDHEHYTSGGYDVSDENKKFQEMITNAKNLIFIFPTWWQGPPAILKGFIDRVFTARYAFKFKGYIPIGLLKGRRAIIITSQGGPRIYQWLVTGDRAIKAIKKDVLEYCGIKTTSYAIGNARDLTDRKKHEIHKKVKKALKKII